MSHPRRFAFAVTNTAVIITSIGCGRKQIAETPGPAHQSGVQQPAVAPRPTSIAPTVNRPDPNADTRRAGLEERIHFAFDQWTLSPAARGSLVAKVAVLRATPTVTLRIEGHADERGSDEYNLALSNRRAGEAKRFLVQQGIEANRLENVGFGEEQPLETGHDERAWSMNRRAEFRIIRDVGGRAR